MAFEHIHGWHIRRWLRHVERKRMVDDHPSRSLVAEHIRRYDVRGWLLRNACTEDANTIGVCIARLSDDEFTRRLARALTER
jgi:hypothetical protein